MVVERHLMRLVENIINDELDLDALRELIKSDEDVEEQKRAIRKEIQTITKSLVALRPFSPRQ